MRADRQHHLPRQRTERLRAGPEVVGVVVVRRAERDEDERPRGLRPLLLRRPPREVGPDERVDRLVDAVGERLQRPGDLDDRAARSPDELLGVVVDAELREPRREPREVRLVRRRLPEREVVGEVGLVPVPRDHRRRELHRGDAPPPGEHDRRVAADVVERDVRDVVSQRRLDLRQGVHRLVEEQCGAVDGVGRPLLAGALVRQHGRVDERRRAGRGDHLGERGGDRVGDAVTACDELGDDGQVRMGVAVRAGADHQDMSHGDLPGTGGRGHEASPPVVDRREPGGNGARQP